jgi:hypothetical protein
MTRFLIGLTGAFALGGIAVGTLWNHPLPVPQWLVNLAENPPGTELAIKFCDAQSESDGIAGCDVQIWSRTIVLTMTPEYSTEIGNRLGETMMAMWEPTLCRGFSTESTRRQFPGWTVQFVNPATGNVMANCKIDTGRVS